MSIAKVLIHGINSLLYGWKIDADLDGVGTRNHYPTDGMETTHSTPRGNITFEGYDEMESTQDWEGGKLTNELYDGMESTQVLTGGTANWEVTQ